MIVIVYTKILFPLDKANTVGVVYLSCLSAVAKYCLCVY